MSESPDGPADCLFCRIVAGDVPSTVVREDRETYAFRDINPQAPTHVLVVPRRHVEDVAMLAEEPALAAVVLAAAREVARLEGIKESGYRVVFNVGEDAGRTVFHVHAHVLGGAPMGRFGSH